MIYRQIAIVHDGKSDEQYATGHRTVADAVPLSGAQAIASALKNRGYADILFITTTQINHLLLAGLNHNIRCAFNLGSGFPSSYRYGQTPILLESLSIPYSGNDPHGMLICRNKWHSKMLAASIGIETPPSIFLDRFALERLQDLDESFLPVIVKPNNLGGSIGISSRISLTVDATVNRVKELLFAHPDGVLLEKFIPGMDITVLILGNGRRQRAISMCLREVSGQPLPLDHVLGYYEKTRAERYLKLEWFPASEYVEPTVKERCEQWARAFVNSYRLRDYNRLDFRLDVRGQLHFLECNAQPTLGPAASYGRCANERILVGETIEDLYVLAALERMGLDVTKAE